MGVLGIMKTETKNLPSPPAEDRSGKLDVLASGYTPTKRKVEIVVLTVFFIFWSAAGLNILRGSTFDNVYLSLVGLVFSILFADFVGGVVHWACDTWGTPSTKFWGVFIRSFREHHLDPQAMTKHDFVEVSADSCIVPIPFVIAASLWRIENVFQLEWLILNITFWTTFFVMMTNQIHKWAHMNNNKRPFIVQMLQKTGVILSPEMHCKHHRPPFDVHYCIFNGWMNPILASFNFWKHVENVITRYTGYYPRADDASWTGRFEVNERGESVRKTSNCTISTAASG